MMLCRAEKAVRRAERERRNAVWPRILVLQANTAEQEQRIPFMNAVFAAQKKVNGLQLKE